MQWNELLICPKKKDGDDKINLITMPCEPNTAQIYGP